MIQKSALREKTCCFTGHRQISPDEWESVWARLEKTIKQLYQRGIIYYGAGGALGFDTLAAETVLRLQKKDYSKIKLILILPCYSQTYRWNAGDAAKYEEIKRKANKIVYISKEYTKTCMHERNRHMVNNSSVCICYLTKNSGGTAYTVSFAEKKGLEIINVAYSARSLDFCGSELAKKQLCR